MSTRELAYSIIDGFTDEQIEGFVLMFKNSVPDEDIPNAETEAAMLEADRIARDPNVKAYTDTNEMMRDLLS
ncbi:MAG: hypothetical protein NC253_07160 [Ruminococcus sp.]|nr:hypothetical protein [Ruminococcus sp.]MCM1479941.1 hypothetical protein [Muribaculaceae bacterium]